MSSQTGEPEVQELRRELRALVARVEFLERQLAASSSSSPVTVNYQINPPSAPYVESVGSGTGSGSTGGSAATQTPVPPKAGAGYYSDAFRREVAEEIGGFLKRSLEGVFRGESGRQKLGIPSRYYILVRDFEGVVRNPVGVYHTLAAIKPLIEERGSVSKLSIFVGFPTIWEAKIAVAVAGLSWPQNA